MIFYQNVKQKVIAMLTRTSTPEEEAKRQSILVTTENYFIDQDKPLNFREDDQTNAVVEFENQFNSLSTALEANGASVKGLTVMQFYGKLNYFRELNEKYTK